MEHRPDQNLLQEWEYEPLNKLYLAVMGAFHSLMFPTRRSVYFVTEPEACALFTVQHLISTNEANLIPVLVPSHCSLTHATLGETSAKSFT